MSFGKKLPQKQMYEEMKDTPYITNLRDLSQKGYEGYEKNYNRVNVFSPETQRSLDDYTNDVYRRANSEFDKNYRETMQKYANANYGQFGTSNATPALYRTDMENMYQQRKLADMAYNKALYRENLVNNELARRYNTLNMFNSMLEKGQTPYQLDLANWNIRNTNKDRQFQNEEIKANAGGGAKGALGGALSGAITGFVTGGPVGALAGAGIGALGGAQSKYNSQGNGMFGTTGASDLASGLVSGYNTWRNGGIGDSSFRVGNNNSSIMQELLNYLNSTTPQDNYTINSPLDSIMDSVYTGSSSPIGNAIGGYLNPVVYNFG